MDRTNVNSTSSFKNILTELLMKFLDGTSDLYEKLLISINFIPDPNIPVKGVSKIIELLEDGNVKKAERFYRLYILNYYNASKLKELKKMWGINPTLAKRKHILDDILDAYMVSQHNLVIPVLLTQIEGYVWDMNEHSGRITQNKYKELINNQEHLLIFRKSIRTYMENDIMQFFTWGEDHSDLNRNAILHGYDAQYGTKINSLKLLILFNTLQSFYLATADSSS